MVEDPSWVPTNMIRGDLGAPRRGGIIIGAPLGNRTAEYVDGIAVYKPPRGDGAPALAPLDPKVRVRLQHELNLASARRLVEGDPDTSIH